MQFYRYACPNDGRADIFAAWEQRDTIAIESATATSAQIAPPQKQTELTATSAYAAEVELQTESAIDTSTYTAEIEPQSEFTINTSAQTAPPQKQIALDATSAHAAASEPQTEVSNNDTHQEPCVTPEYIKINTSRGNTQGVTQQRNEQTILSVEVEGQRVLKPQKKEAEKPFAIWQGLVVQLMLYLLTMEICKKPRT